jgi:nucleotide-binding universal stress UspA family protein
MFRTIMVPLDRTRFAEAALPLAMGFAKRHGATIELVTVWQPLPSIDYDSSSASELWRWEQDSREEDRRYMSTVAEKVQRAMGGSVLVRYLLGEPAEELAKRATREADIVVMSTHAPAPLTRAFLGSVSDKVARKAAVPLLLVKPESPAPEVEIVPSRPFRRILIPLDGSALAETALDRSLIAGLEPNTTEITLLHVTGFPAVLTPDGAAMEPGGLLLGGEGQDADAYLAGVAERIATTWKCRVAPRVVVSTSTGAAIVDFAAANGNDLIAMATHGRGGAARLLMGSIADTVVRTSRVPTLLVPPVPADKQKLATKGARVAMIDF